MLTRYQTTEEAQMVNGAMYNLNMPKGAAEMNRFGILDYNS
jgi:hypothetical protein